MSEVASAFDVAERFWAMGPPVDVEGIILALGIEYVEEPRVEMLSGFIERYGDGLPDRRQFIAQSCAAAFYCCA